MCTAATYNAGDAYFGRTLDYEFSYGDKITITPRNYTFHFKHTNDISSHYAIIGMAHIADNYPLYYDAINEMGVGMAGLNFVGNAFYPKLSENKTCVAQFELIPWILCQCKSVEEARKLLNGASIVCTSFNEKLPTAQLHWIISDKNSSIVVESTAQGLSVYENPVGVLTNNPPFPIQMFNLNNYMNLSPKQPENKFSENIDFNAYSRGMGAMGLPGDLSSASRFIRVAFVKLNSKSGKDESEAVSQFFHILGSVDQQRGCCEVADGKYEITIYTSCCNLDKGIYYYTTYNNHQIIAIDMHNEDLEKAELISYEPIATEQIMRQN